MMVFLDISARRFVKVVRKERGCVAGGGGLRCEWGGEEGVSVVSGVHVSQET